MNAGKIITIVAAAALLSGCGTASMESGMSDPDAYSPVADVGSREHPASLIEVEFDSEGHTTVTKNLPADAAHALRDRMRGEDGHILEPHEE